MTATSPIQTSARGISAAGALLLAVAGNILVVAVVAVTLGLATAAAFLVFGAGLLDAF
ncbi:hypothetical protein [Microbacterium sp. Root166]|uniref:hypothetical protein n=1 Tax=Microbacterium sp. Root166 TaxID=1736478 RepID=UPI000A48B323|nr:hypothetical protein [Microbacterium sp. Root166]